MTQDKKKLFDYLQTQRMMSLATSGGTMWAASVYYAMDKDLNLYFVTGPKTEHGKNFLKNPGVCGTICDSTQPNGGDKIGVQFRGCVSQVNGLESLKRAVDLWNKINPGVEKWVNVKNIRAKKINSRVFKITPEKIKLFTVVKGEEHEEIYNF